MKMENKTTSLKRNLAIEIISRFDDDSNMLRKLAVDGLVNNYTAEGIWDFYKNTKLLQKELRGLKK